MAILLSIDILRGSAPSRFAFASETVVLVVLAGTIFIALLIAIFLWSRTLKVRVEQKTAELERRTVEVKELNEQLRISNEELQTSNEEYESANEELQLLNDDLNQRNARLAEATEEMRALKDFNEKVIAAVPSVLLVVDRHLKIVSANDKYYATFPGVLEKAEGAFLADALPHALLYEEDMIRKIQDVAQSSTSIRLPEVFYTDEHGVRRFVAVYICAVAGLQSADQPARNVLLVINDITEIKRLENELRSRERYFRNLVHNSIVAIVATDSEANLTLFNEGAERLMGLSSAEIRGTPASGIFFGDTEFDRILDGLRSGGKVEDYETEFIGRNRERIQVSLFATSLREEEGELAGYLIVGIDIRKRKEAERNLLRRNKELSTLYSVGRTLGSSSPAEQRLREAAEQVAAAFASPVCAVAVCSPHDNSCVEKVYAVGAQHLSSKESLDRLVETMTRRVQRQKRAVFGPGLLDDAELCKAVTEPQINGPFISVPLSAGPEVTGSLTIVRLDQPPFESEDIELLSSLGERIAVAIENEKLYATQKENVSQLRALSNATKVIGSILDPDGVLEALTAQAMQISPCRHVAVLLYSPQGDSLSLVASKSAGRTRRWKSGMSFPASGSGLKRLLETPQPSSCSDAEQEKCPLKQALVDAGVTSCLCLPMVFDGSRGVLVLGQDDGRGLSDTAVHILRDLLAHASLSIRNARLYTALQTAYADLKKAQDAMVKAEKYRAIGELSAGVAHDFNNALSIILGRAQHLLSLTQDKAVAEGLKSIENASKDAAGIVRRMQEFSKAVAQKPYSRVDVNDMVRQVLDIIEPRWRELAEVEGVELKVSHKLQKVAPISGDVGELREALTNILFNSIEAMPRGGKLSVRTGVRGDRVFIEIKDTGSGMSPEIQKKIFRPFFTTKADGMGLGLSLVYGTVNRHNGELQIESQPNKGTEVTLSFPIDASAREVRETVAPYPLRKATVLIVDDNREVTQTLRQMLESASHEVTAVTNGEEGIKKYRESKFDVVLTDIGMPGLSGWEVSRAIKAHDHDAKIILITAWGVQLDPERLKESGASLVIQKPFEKGKILSAIEDVLPACQSTPRDAGRAGGTAGSSGARRAP
jgi:PAS domain S-box-containing protein